MLASNVYEDVEVVGDLPGRGGVDERHRPGEPPPLGRLRRPAGSAGASGDAHPADGDEHGRGIRNGTPAADPATPGDPARERRPLRLTEEPNGQTRRGDEENATNAPQPDRPGGRPRRPGHTATAQKPATATKAPAPAAKAGRPALPPSVLEPAAMAALQGMGAYLRTLKTFQVEAATTDEDVLDDGQKIQYAGVTNILAQMPDRPARRGVERPARAASASTTGRPSRCSPKRLNYYATVPAPPTIGQLADMLDEKYGFSVPLADLFRWGSPELERRRHQGGHRPRPRRRPGHHVPAVRASAQAEIDWQIWIQKGDFPLPRKLVITTKTDEARPQHSAVYTWNLAPSFNAATFTFDPPAGAGKVVLEKAGRPAPRESRRLDMNRTSRALPLARPRGRRRGRLRPAGGSRKGPEQRTQQRHLEQEHERQRNSNKNVNVNSNKNVNVNTQPERRRRRRRRPPRRLQRRRLLLPRRLPPDRHGRRRHDGRHRHRGGGGLGRQHGSVGLLHRHRQRLRLPAVRQHLVPAADVGQLHDLHRREPPAVNPVPVRCRP